MNKFALSITVVLLSSAALPTMVLAQAAPTQDFATIDADKSGEVSYGELQLVLPNVSQEQFNTADADKSGGLSATEFATISAAGTGTLTQQPATNTQPDNNNNAAGTTNGGVNNSNGSGAAN